MHGVGKCTDTVAMEGYLMIPAFNQGGEQCYHVKWDCYLAPTLPVTVIFPTNNVDQQSADFASFSMLTDLETGTGYTCIINIQDSTHAIFVPVVANNLILQMQPLLPTTPCSGTDYDIQINYLNECVTHVLWHQCLDYLHYSGVTNMYNHVHGISNIKEPETTLS
jgi:hypothetical protein